MSMQLFSFPILHAFRVGRRRLLLAATTACVAALSLTPVPASAQLAAELAAELAHANVIAARKLVNARMWDKLQAMVPLARDGVLGVYPEYWVLRQQIQDSGSPLPMTEI